jgi:hypothetical protein
MEKIFALIKNGVVENTIVADEVFAAAIAAQYDFVIRVDELDPRPGIGWLYDGENFSQPVIEE